VDRGRPEISVRRQCELLGVNRSGLYYQPVGESEENLQLMRLLDEQYTRTPFYGSRKMTAWLARAGHEVNRKRVSRLMELMGIAAVYPKAKLSRPGEGHRIYPYLLRGTTVERVNRKRQSNNRIDNGMSYGCRTAQAAGVSSASRRTEVEARPGRMAAR
jgi:putative transposase